MVRLDDQPDVIVGNAVNEPHFPEGACPVERYCLDATHQVEQLCVPARTGERCEADVVVDVEVHVVDPYRPTLPERHLHHALAEPWNSVQAAVDVGLQFVESNGALVVAQCVANEQRERSDVLGLVRCLDPQEHCVRRCHRFVCHSS